MAFSDKDVRSDSGCTMKELSGLGKVGGEGTFEEHQIPKGSKGRGSYSFLGHKTRQGEKVGDENCYVYFIQSYNTKLIKIGMTNDLKNRLISLQTGSAEKLYYIGTLFFSRVEKSKEVEKCLHTIFGYCRSHGEWFESNPSLVAFIKKHIKDTDELDAELRSRLEIEHERRVDSFVAADPNEDSRTLTRKSLLEIAWRPQEF